ncbi:beta-cubebene synthase-like isoform X2 [Magnolia sinica]|uniref:beta-cubebene synthase-like isoform X2 n=1 Tax=Magnolia sinica TaxID=86752 RepID=UPI00265A9AC1|nr:beta-cubebene synthase-like isoform X2 [Magnolia sinica]
METNSRKEIGRACANFHPSVWGDWFVTTSSDEMIDVLTKQRAEELKEQVKSMLSDVNDCLQELNLINEIQRLGVAYHFEAEIKDALHKMYDAHINGNDVSDDLHATALWFRLLRQQGYNVSSNAFQRFKDEKGEFKATLKDDIRGLLSLYEAAYLGTREDKILDEAIHFTTEHLKLAMPYLSSPLSNLVQLALDVPLQKRVERLQSRYYISIYQEEEEKNDVLLEFAKLDFNMLQSLHKKELGDISRWWKENDFSRKLPFIRDRVVECYFWVLGVYFEPRYSRARRMMTSIISLLSVLDDIYDVYGTLEELELYTAALDRWDWAAMDLLPEYLKVHYNALLNVVEKFEDELSLEGKLYRIPYLKKALEQKRTHVASAIQCYMKEHGTTYTDTCKMFREDAAGAWKDVNMECIEPIPVPREVIMRPLNLVRVIELLYQHRDSYTNSAEETKERITMVLVDPITV